MSNAESGHATNLPPDVTSSEFLRALLDSTLDAVITIDSDGRIVDWNRQAESMFGWQRDEVVGKELAELIIPPDQREAHRLGLKNYLRTGEGTILRKRIELEGLSRAGERIPLELAVCDVHEGGHVHFHAFLRDQRQKNQAAAAEVRHQKFVASILDSLPSNIVVIDPDGMIRSVNKRWQRFYEENGGEPSKLFIGTSYFAVCEQTVGSDSEMAGAAIRGIRTVLDGDQGEFTLEYPCHAPDKQRWFLMQVAPLWDENNRRRGAVISHLDITRRKLGELRRAELSAIIESTDDAVIGKALDGTIISWNRGAEQIYGYTADEVIGKSITTIVPEDLRDEIAAILARIRQGERIDHVRRRRLRKDGQEIVVSLTISPIKDDSGEIRGASAIARDITRLEASEEKRRQTEQRFRGTLENATIGIGHVDASGRLLLANPTLCEMLGYDEEELCTKTLNDLTHKEDAAEGEERFHQLTFGEIDSYSLEKRLIRANGEIVRANCMLAVPRDVQEQIEYCVVIVEDLTERAESEAELERAREAAGVAQRVKADFLANVSHELRTPMNAIIGMTDLAIREEVSPDVRDYLETARESADTLLHLLNEILDFSKIESGKFELELAEFDLREAIDETLKSHSLRASEKGLELLCDIPSAVPDRLVGDALRLKQVITNLVGNAIKFTPTGEVVTRVGVEAKDGDEIVLHFAVEDTGIGISKADQDRIFAPFTQADTSTTRVFGGTGLGLAIATELTKLMGGTLWVDSDAGRGSRFHFTARLTAPSAEPAAPLSPAELRDRPILIVDDNESNRRILVEIVKSWDMHPATVCDGASALTEMQRAHKAGNPYPIVLLDVLMPEMDGFTVAERIQTSGDLPPTTILMVSSAHRSTYKHRAAELNVKAYLEKPISRSDLLRVLLAAIAGESPEEDMRRPIGMTPYPMSILVVEDIPANQKVVDAILGKRGHQVTIVGDGTSAIQEFQRNAFAAILMDIQMPGMDGFSATARIRGFESDKKTRTPIIAMTAHAMRGDRERCLAAGMDAYIAKPIDADQLIELVESFATGSAVDPAKAAIPQTTNDGTQNLLDDGPRCNIEATLKRLGGDHDLLIEMVDLFKEDGATLLQQIRTELDSRNGDEVHRAAHSLAGLAAHFDAQTTVRKARAIEDLALQSRFAEIFAIVDDLENEVQALIDALEKETSS